MTLTTPRTLEDYLGLEYTFHVIADPDGGYVIDFPDLPGCMTQVDSLDEVAPMAEEVRTLWIETEYERGMDIPLPSYPEEYSGKFNVRLPRSLHRALAEAAEREGVSLNQYVVALLARGDAQARIERQLGEIAARVTNPPPGGEQALAEPPTAEQPRGRGAKRGEARSGRREFTEREQSSRIVRSSGRT